MSEPRVKCEYCRSPPWIKDAQTHLSWHLGRGDWKLAELTAPPTAATDRKLAPGWRVATPEETTMRRCWPPGEDRHIEHGGPAYVCTRGVGDSSCAACAEASGVFADSPTQPVPGATMRDALRGKPASIKMCSVVIAGVPCPLLDGHLFSGGHGLRYGTWMAGFDPGGDGRHVAVMPAKSVARTRCGTCTHVHGDKPCDGTSPFGSFPCPCGHPKAVARRERVNIVGTYGGSDTWTDQVARRTVDHMNNAKNYTATLHANLAREKPPGRRPIRTVARYEGNSDD